MCFKECIKYLNFKILVSYINTTTKPKPQQSKPSQAALKYGTSAFGFYGETTALTSSCQKPHREKR